MKLLFDQNLSHRLVAQLNDVYPDSSHVRNLGLQKASDTRIWNHAKDNDFIVVSKDADFHQRSFVLGFPPKVIWLRLGNCSTKAVEKVLREHQSEVATFAADMESAILILADKVE